MLLVKRFSKNKNNLKGFLTQIKIKITNKGIRLLILIKQIAYAGLFVTSNTLK